MLNAPVAQAANECGAGTTVSCTSAGNVYPNGITYNNANQTVTLQSGVVVNAGTNTGVELGGTGTQTINITSGVTIGTTGSNNAVDIENASGLITVSGAGSAVMTTGTNGYGYVFISPGGINATVGSLNIGGDGGIGIFAESIFGAPIDITSGSITVTGSNGAGGISALSAAFGSSGAITIDTSGGTVSLTGTATGAAITASALLGGAVTITTAGVATASDNADAVSASTSGTGADGAVTINTTAGTVSTSGAGSRGIVASSTAGAGSGLVTVKAATVTTTGTGAASAIVASSTSGPVTVTAGTLSTAGDGAIGVSAVGAGLINVTTGSINTAGASAYGIEASSGAAGAAGLTTVDSTAGTITTLGAKADGINISSATGANATVMAAAISATGDNAAGIRIDNSTGGTISITSQSVVTHGNFTSGILDGSGDAIQAINGGTGTAGDITIDASGGAGLLQTFGSSAEGVRAQSTAGGIDITVGTVKTAGNGATAIDAHILGGTGNLTVIAKGDITATGASADSYGFVAGGVSAINDGSGSVNVTTKSVSTVADNAGAVFAQGAGGTVMIDTTGGTVSTQGGGANGVEATFNGSSGAATITTANVNTQGFIAIGVVGLTGGPNAALTIDTTAGTIDTKGTFATGINAVTGSFPGTVNAGTLTIRAGNITTEGNAVGIVADANGGAINITASGAIHTGSDGIQTNNGVTGGGSVTTTINVTGSIIAAGAHGIDAQIAAGGANMITVGGSVTASVGTGIFTSGTGDSVTVASGGSVSGATGVQFTDSGTTSLTNSGSITGTGGNAVLFSGSTADTFTNSGTVNGNVSLGSGNDLAILNTGSSISGTMNGGNGTDTLRLQGTGSGSLDISKVTNFEIGQKMDAGTWTLTGTGTISNSTTISGGVLSVDGQLTSPTVTVAGGGTLGGTGTIIGNVTTNGNIAPGNSIGTLNIAGNYAQASGSTYTVELNTTTSDLIKVTGPATIQSGAAVNVLVAPGFYTLGMQYTILSATGGVTGQFSTLTDNAPFVEFQLNADPDDIFLDVIQSGVPFDQIAQTRNQIAAASGLQSLGPGNPIFDAALMLDTPTALHAFDLLSGEIHASIVTVMLDDSRFVRDAIFGRLRQDIGGAASILAPNIATMNFADVNDDAALLAYSPKPAKVDDPIGPAVAAKRTATPNERVVTSWAQLLGDWGHVSGDGNAAALDRSTGGLVSGVDATLSGQHGDLWRFGLAGGYQQTSVRIDDRSSSGNINAYDVAAYAGMQQGALGLRVGSAYTTQQIATNRNIVFSGFSDTTSASYMARTAQAFGEAGYGFTERQMALEPFADLALVDLRIDSFTEAGGAAALAGMGGSYDTIYSTLGLRAATLLPWPVLPNGLAVKGSIGWQHAFGTTVPIATLAFASGSSPLAVAGVPIAKNAAAVELGVEARINSAATLNVGYSGELAGTAQDHGVTATFRQRF
jgi:fibronectin-binding autotransporter adhesin